MLVEITQNGREVSVGCPLYLPRGVIPHIIEVMPEFSQSSNDNNLISYSSSSPASGPYKDVTIELLIDTSQFKPHKKPSFLERLFKKPTQEVYFPAELLVSSKLNNVCIATIDFLTKKTPKLNAVYPEFTSTQEKEEIVSRLTTHLRKFHQTPEPIFHFVAYPTKNYRH